jgi:TAP C-terminal domain
VNSPVFYINKVTTTTNSGLKKSFSRTFVLQPHGDGVVLTNDVLTVRDYAEVYPDSYPQLAGYIQLMGYKSQFALEDQQFALVIQLSKLTGMNFATCVECLRLSGWDLEAAGNAFLGSKASIPAACFLA